MQANYEVEMRLDVKIPMRDGVHLSADIYHPKANGPFSHGTHSHALQQQHR